MIESIENLARSVHSQKYASRGLDHIFALTEDFITPPFKPALWPTIKVFAAWSRSGCDSLGKCLPTLLPALSHPELVSTTKNHFRYMLHAFNWFMLS